MMFLLLKYTEAIFVQSIFTNALPVVSAKLIQYPHAILPDPFLR
jgi:hypothetical protein